MSVVTHLQYGVVSGAGITLPQPHSTGMQSSLPLLKKNYKFKKVFFWGKLTGMMGDYLIAMGIEESYATPKFFFCQDGVSWAQLPVVTDAMMADVAKIESNKMLSGDIAKVYEIPVPLPDDAEEGAEPPEPKTITEIERLAVMVVTIDTECAMTPAGALMKKADGNVVDQPTFAGLDMGKATNLKSWVFMNKPKDVPLNADAVTAATDFLTSAEAIVPSGSLVCKFDEAINSVCYRSLLYPGFFAYTIVGAPMHGYCYFGTGEKNADIAFMLP